MEKLKLDPDEVAVESFPTGEEADEPRGTVHAEAGCTYNATCLCPTRYYYCGDGYQTIYSCDYSMVEPCPTSIYNC
ncbi:MAG TPA: hypothetical protein VFR37_00200 [Longimicrobium sp.]|nr:hypothetical protein [Longimicrobium sp.]